MHFHAKRIYIGGGEKKFTSSSQYNSKAGHTSVKTGTFVYVPPITDDKCALL